MDTETGTCQKCGDTCATCSVIDKCLTCPTGFELAETICISCAANEFISGDSC